MVKDLPKLKIGEKVNEFSNSQKESIENLMYYMLKDNYKELCDKIKVAMLDKLVELSKNYGGILTSSDLIEIRNGVEKLRVKEKEVQTSAIVQVIDNLISRGNDFINKKEGEKTL